MSSDAEQAAESSGIGEEEEEEDETTADLVGNLKTSVIWELGSKQLCFRLRQSAENGRKAMLKYKGYLNTQTGEHTYKGHLRKKFFSNSPLTLQRVLVAAQEEQQGGEASDPRINPNGFMPAGFRSLLLDDWILSPGLSFNSGSQRKMQYALTLQKAPQFLRHSPKFDCWISGKTNLEVDPKGGQVTTTASVRLKLLRYNVTGKQDVRVSAGLDWLGSGGKWSQVPFLKVSENNFAVKLQNKSWSLLYEM